MKAPVGTRLAGYSYIKRGHQSASTPTINGHAVFKIVEAQIGCCEDLGQHDYLTGVHREMLGHVKDGPQDVDFAALYRSLLKQH